MAVAQGYGLGLWVWYGLGLWVWFRGMANAMAMGMGMAICLGVCLCVGLCRLGLCLLLELWPRGLVLATA